MTNFGLLLPSGRAHLDAGHTAPGIIETAVEAERLGFDSVWAGDTLARAPIDPLTLLGAIAAVTDRVTLGTAALLPALRDPLLTASTLTSLDLLSRGRIVVGVGAGFPGRSEVEFDWARVPWERRNTRLDDIVALWRTLWTGGNSFYGKEFHYDTLPMLPPPHRVGGPPVWLAGFTPSALERAGRLYDGWLPYPPNPADFATGLATVQANVPAAKPVTPALFATVFVGENGRRALEDYCRAYYGAPLQYVETIQVFITGSRAEVAAELRRYADAEHILVRPATVVPEVFAEQVAQVAAMISDSATGVS